MKTLLSRVYKMATAPKSSAKKPYTRKYNTDYKKKGMSKKYERKYNTDYKKKSTYNRKENNLSLAYALSYLSGFGNRITFHDDESQGRYVTVPCVTRFSINTGTLGPKVLIFNPSMNGVYQTMFFDSNGTNSVNLAPAPASRLTSEPPTTSRCLAASLRIQNSTQSQDVGGVVRCLISSAPLETENEWQSPTATDITANLASEIIQMVREHPRARTANGKMLADNQYEVVCARASHSDAHIYKPFENTWSSPAFQSNWNNGKLYQSHNMIILLFEQTSVTNTLEISLSCTLACRFPQQSLISSLSSESQSSSPNFQKILNKLVNDDDKVFQDPLVDMLNPNNQKKKT